MTAEPTAPIADRTRFVRSRRAQAVAEAAAPGRAPVTAPPARVSAPPASAPAVPGPAVELQTPPPITAAEAVAAELQALGVQDFFLMTGRDNGLFVAIQKAGIRQNLARSEAGAVYMADGYSRVTGRPTFVYGCAGPGASNVAGALAEPFWSSSPLIALTSTMNRGDRHRGDYQELDQPKLFEAVTKWGAEAPNGAQVPRLMRIAARTAMSGTPGPVYLGVPSDVFDEPVPAYPRPEPQSLVLEGPIARPTPSMADVEAAVAALATARRPIIVAGNGIHQSAAWRELQRFAEAVRVPVVTSVAGKGSIAETHDLALGTVGRYSRNYANAALRDADAILAIGTGLGGMVTNSFKLVGKDVHLIHVTLDPDALGRNYPTDLGIVADAKAFLELASLATDMPPIAEGRTRYLAELDEQRGRWRRQRAELAQPREGRMRPESVLAAVDELMADDAIVCADTGYASAWAGALLDRRIAGRNFFRADGSLGWAYAGALGAQVAAPDRQVVCVIGDGGFGYHLPEIETAVRLGLPVVAVVLNNQTLAFEEHVQMVILNHRVAEVNDFTDVDYGGVARAFGADGTRVETVAEFREAFASALERRVPTVIDTLVDREAIPPVTRYDAARTREL